MTIDAKKLSFLELREAARKTAITSPKHLLLWLHESGRRWLVFSADDVVDACTSTNGERWSENVKLFQTLIDMVRNHRRRVPSGRVEKIKEPMTNQLVDVQVFKDETLEVEELDRCIRYLVGHILEKDPKWSLENAAL